jgi:hypothetical protein
VLGIGIRHRHLTGELQQPRALFLAERGEQRAVIDHGREQAQGRGEVFGREPV